MTAELLSLRTLATEAPEPASLEQFSGEVVRLYEAHAASLFRLAMAVSHDQEVSRDAVQEAFVKYCVARNAGQEIREERAWLARVMHNQIVDWHRGRKTRGEVPMENAATVADDAVDPESAQLLEERLKEAKAILSPAELRCVQLRAAGMRYHEIAEVMGLRTGTIATFLFRAVRKLKRNNSDSRCPSRS